MVKFDHKTLIMRYTLLMRYALLMIFTFFSFVDALAQNVGIGTTTPSDQLHTTGTVRFENYKGANTRMVQMDTAGRLVVTPAGIVISNATAQVIPDNGCSGGTGISSPINVTGQSLAISSSKIAVRINITHSWDADLRIYLYPPGGGVLVLAAENGGSGDNFTNTVFTDQAPVSITAGTAPFTGQFKPKGGAPECFQAGSPFSNFAAIGSGNFIPNGTWTLRVLDNGINDIGTLNRWSLSFTGPESFSTADENNYIPKFNAGNLTASNIYQQPIGSFTGSIGIGTTNPTASLEINGTLKITDGTQGDKKVLTSDASGKASWQPVNQQYENTVSNLSTTIQGAIVDFNETNIAAPVAGTYLITYFLDAYNTFNYTCYNASCGPIVNYTTAALWNKSAPTIYQNVRIDFQLQDESSTAGTSIHHYSCPDHIVSASLVSYLSANDVIGFKMRSFADPGAVSEIRIRTSTITLVRLY